MLDPDDEIELDLINESNDENNSEIAFFQDALAEDQDEIDIA